jgi:hypothetical protein
MWLCVSRHYQEAKDCFDFIARVPLLAGLHLQIFFVNIFALFTVSAIKKWHHKKMYDFSAIFHGGLKCCLSCLNYWITFTKGLSNWEKVTKKTTRTHRPLSNDLNLSKITFFLGGGQITYQYHRKSVKKVSSEKKHGLMLLFKKNH